MRRSLMFILIAAALGLTSTTATAQDTTNPITPNTSPDQLKTPDLKDRVTQAQRDRIRFLLSGYEYFPTADELRKVTPLAHLVLLQIAQDTSALPSLRLRAIDALGVFPKSDELASLIQTQLGRNDLDSLQRQHYITSSLKVFRENAVPWIKPYLTHADVQTRLSAIHSLGKFGGNPGAKALRDIKPLIQQPWIIENIDKALTPR